MRKWYPALLLAAMLVASIVAFPALPARVATHWDLHNRVNGDSPRMVAAVMLPLLFAGIWALLRVLPTIDPRRENYAKFQGAYDLVVNAVLTLIALVHGMILAAALGYAVGMERVTPMAVGVLMVIIGNVLPQARPNWWFGIRTPWTLSNDRVWERTHRVGGYLFVAAGLLVIAAAWAPPAIAAPALPVVIGIAALGSVLYSFVAWKQETSR